MLGTEDVRQQRRAYACGKNAPARAAQKLPPGEEAAVNAAREALERGDPSVRILRQQLLGAQQELVAASAPQSVREHAVEIRAARQEEQDQARRIFLL